MSLLPTYPFKGSKFHVVLFQNVFVSLICFLKFEKDFEEKERGRIGIRIEKKKKAFGWFNC